MKLDTLKNGDDLRKWRHMARKPKVIRREDVATWSDYSYSQVCKIEQNNKELEPKFIKALIRNYK